MSNTIGRVDFVASLDGTILPAEAKVLGERIGRALSDAVNKRLRTSFRGLGDNVDIDSVGADLGERLAASLGARFRDKFQSSIGDAGAKLRKAIDMGPVLDDIGEFIVVTERGADATRDYGAAWRESRDAAAGFNAEGSRGVRIVRELEAGFDGSQRNSNRFATALRNINGNLRSMAGNWGRNREGAFALGNSFRYIQRRAAAAFGEAESGGRGLLSVIGSLNDRWKTATHGVRQFTFYVLLFANLATEIAVLGSAAGSGLTILASAALAGAVGIGVAVAAFAGLNKEISELPAGVQEAASAFQGLGGIFGDLQNQIQVTALGDLAPQFTAFGGLIQTLTPSILLVADAVGQVVTQLVAMLTSSNGVSVLTALIAGAAPVFELLMSAVFNLGGALGNIFVAAQPYVLMFATWLNDLMTQFNNWTQSVAGQTALQAWFENGKAVFEGLGTLLGLTGQMLSSLVTPSAVSGLVDFMGLIGQLMAPLGEFLQVLGELSIFNIIAQLLLTVFAAAAPLMPLLGQLAGAFSFLLQGILAAALPLLQGIIQAVVALAQPIISALLPAVMLLLPVFQQLVAAFMPLVDMLGLVAANLAGMLVPLIATLAAGFISLVQAVLPIAMEYIPVLLEVFVALANAILPLVGAILPPLVDLFNFLLKALLPIFPAVMEIVSAVLELITPLLELLGPIIPPLTSILKTLVTGGVDFLKMGLTFLTPVIMGVVNAIRDILIPVIKMIKDVLKGVTDFITGVFTGNWEAAWNGVVSIFHGIWNGIAGFLKGVVNGMISTINGIIGGVNAVSGAVGIPAIPKIPRLARGGIAWQSMLANIGEAGPEMVVPLRRPLGMVDPQVREVSAFAQGKLDPSGGSGVTVAEGAIVVNDKSGDPRRTSQEVLNRLVEQVAG